MRNNKIFLFLATFCLLAGVFTSCQKDSVTLRLRMASFSHDGKVHMEGYTPKWDTGSDLVCVNGETCTVSNNAVSVSPSIDYKAVYPASICGSLENVNGVGVYNLTIPEYQVYKTVTVGGSTIQVVEAPMGAHSNTSVGSSADLYFKNLGALLAITVENQANRGDLIVDNIVVTSDSKPLWGSATVAMPEVTDNQSNGYNPYYVINEDNNTHRSVTLAGNATGGSMNVSIATGSSKQFYVYVPAFTPSPSNLFTFEVQVHNNSGEGVYRRAQTTQGSGNIALNQIGALTFSLIRGENGFETSWLDNTRPAGALRVGEFSVGANTKVYFSAGNLQYLPSEDKWRIAEHQWDYVGYYNPAPNSATATHYGTVANGSNRYTSQIIGEGALSSWTYWIDLFGWGTSGYSGANNQAMPYDYVTSGKTYGGTADLNANYDWGLHNTIWYGGDSSPAGTWRTLTSGEWNYLLGNGTRARKVDNQKGLGYTHSLVKVNVGDVDIPGLLIYPDDYHTTDPHPTVHTGTEIINLNDYEGCAFLPCAGIRSGISTENGVNYPKIEGLPGQVLTPLGYYWTATNASPNPNYIHFPVSSATNSYFSSLSDKARYTGCSVRLVYVVN